ncbi:unnamed protein product [Ectocarpus sp. 13 AM-2016]
MKIPQQGGGHLPKKNKEKDAPFTTFPTLLSLDVTYLITVYFTKKHLPNFLAPRVERTGRPDGGSDRTSKPRPKIAEASRGPICLLSEVSIIGQPHVQFVFLFLRLGFCISTTQPIAAAAAVFPAQAALIGGATAGTRQIPPQKTIH